MGLPKVREALPFYRSALQRFEDARFLLQGGRTTGAVYLAGYGVECILKALVLNSTAAGERKEVLNTFRGAKAHDYGWLRSRYAKAGGGSLPQEIREQFVDVSTWSTDFRYRPGSVEPEDADAFLAAAEAIIEWGKERM